MQQAAYHDKKRARWTHGMARERQFGLPRGMLVSQASSAEALVQRALAAGRLDGATLDYLRNILTTTVQDWVRRRTS